MAAFPVSGPGGICYDYAAEGRNREACTGREKPQSCPDWSDPLTSLVVERPVVRIIRSANRRRTVTARWAEAGTVLEILAPAGMPEAELAPIVERLKERLERHRDRAENADDAQLARRAMEINREMFAGRLHWREIRYVANQERRFGSCTPGTGIIRISHRVAHMPAFRARLRAGT